MISHRNNITHKARSELHHNTCHDNVRLMNASSSGEQKLSKISVTFYGDTISGGTIRGAQLEGAVHVGKGLVVI